MAEIHASGSLLVGEGVFIKGTMRVPGVASVDGKLEGELSADSVFIQQNGSMDGQTTANHVRVAGTLTDTTVANRTLVVESTGLVAGSITYQELEIKKGGSLQGGIYKVGREVPAAPARAQESQRAGAPEPAAVAEAASAATTAVTAATAGGNATPAAGEASSAAALGPATAAAPTTAAPASAPANTNGKTKS